jgi:hypothetical protein
MDGTNHVDEGSVADWTFKESGSPNSYQVHFHFDGTSGNAEIHIEGSKLYWRVTKEDKASQTDPFSFIFSTPKQAILIKQPSKKEWPPCNT